LKHVCNNVIHATTGKRNELKHEYCSMPFVMNTLD
jgi:hypothetical protein